MGEAAREPEILGGAVVGPGTLKTRFRSDASIGGNLINTLNLSSTKSPYDFFKKKLMLARKGILLTFSS